MTLARFLRLARRSATPLAFLRDLGRWFFSFAWLRAGTGLVVSADSDGATVSADLATLHQELTALEGAQRVPPRTVYAANAAWHPAWLRLRLEHLPDVVTVSYADDVYDLRVHLLVATERVAGNAGRQQRWELDMSLRFRTAELAQIDLILPSVVIGDGQVRWTRSYGSGSLPEAADAATAAAYLPGKDFAHVHVASLDLGPGGAWAWNNPGLSEFWQTRGADLVQDQGGQYRGGLRFAENLNGGILQLLDIRSELGPNDFGRGLLQAAESDPIPAGSDGQVYAVYDAAIPRWRLVLDPAGYTQYQVVGYISTDAQNRLLRLLDYTRAPALPALGAAGSLTVVTGVNFDTHSIQTRTLTYVAGRIVNVS